MGRQFQVLACAFVALLLGQPVQARDYSAFASGNVGDRSVHSVTVGATAGFVPAWFEGSPWELYGEAAVGRWWLERSKVEGDSHFMYYSLAPMLRYRFSVAGVGCFAEIGIGAAVISPIFHTRETRFSTAVNFDDRLGLGCRFGDALANELGIRVQHLSNGGFKDPNPGINFVGLRYARHF